MELSSLILMWLPVVCLMFLVLIMFIWLFGNFSVNVSQKIISSLLVFSETPHYSYIGPFKHTLSLRHAMFIKKHFFCVCMVSFWIWSILHGFVFFNLPPPPPHTPATSNLLLTASGELYNTRCYHFYV